MGKSIIQSQKECFICKTILNLEEHHIFFGSANRKLSEKYGLKVFLCLTHHKGIDGVHGKNGKKLNDYLHQIAEKKWLEYYNKTIEDFIREFGKNYI